MARAISMPMIIQSILWSNRICPLPCKENATIFLATRVMRRKSMPGLRHGGGRKLGQINFYPVSNIGIICSQILTIPLILGGEL